MLVIVHNILSPYRVPLFNSLSEALNGDLIVLLSRPTHPRRRQWSIPWDRIAFKYEFLTTKSIRIRERELDLTFGTSSALSRWSPRAVVVCGWDLTSSWSALRWSGPHSVATAAWVESGLSTGSVRGPLSNRVRRSFLRRVDQVLVSGDEAASFVRSLRPDVPISLLRNSVGLDGLLELPSLDHRTSIAFVGELSERKGFDVLLEALPSLLHIAPKIRIVGNGPMSEVLRQVALGDERIEYLGFVEGQDLLDVYAAAAVVLIPSRRDPAPLVASEAMAAGVPVVLGPGVGNRDDLHRLCPSAVALMDDLTVGGITDATRRMIGQRVSHQARIAFTPQACAAQLLAAVE